MGSKQIGQTDKNWPNRQKRSKLEGVFIQLLFSVCPMQYTVLDAETDAMWLKRHSLPLVYQEKCITNAFFCTTGRLDEIRDVPSKCCGISDKNSLDLSPCSAY